MPARRYQFSQFAYLRREEDVLVVESPLAHAQVVLHDFRVTALVSALAIPLKAQELTIRVSNLPVDAVPLLLVLLAAGGMIDEVDRAEADAGHVLCSRDAWEFHDLLFHARSRQGRPLLRPSATFRPLAGRMEMPPAVAATGRRILSVVST